MGQKLTRGKRNREDIEFEMKFYEAILKTTPNFIEALVVLGDLYTKMGRHLQGLGMDQRLVKLRPDDPSVLYNLACSYSLLNNLDESLAIIKTAIRFGYDDFEFMQYDEDLANLRRDTRFQRFLSSIVSQRINSQKISNVHEQTP